MLCVLAGRWANAVSLLEGHLGLTGADYADPFGAGQAPEGDDRGYVAPGQRGRPDAIASSSSARTGRGPMPCRSWKVTWAGPPAHYADPLLGKHPRATTEGLRPDTTALLMDTLSRCSGAHRSACRSQVGSGRLPGPDRARTCADPAALGQAPDRTTTEGLPARQRGPTGEPHRPVL